MGLVLPLPSPVWPHGCWEECFLEGDGRIPQLPLGPHGLRASGGNRGGLAVLLFGAHSDLWHCLVTGHVQEPRLSGGLKGHRPDGSWLLRCGASPACSAPPTSLVTKAAVRGGCVEAKWPQGD